MRKPENRIFTYAIEHLQCNPQECIFVDNSVKNLIAAENSVGINTILFNRDSEEYSGNTVNDFRELDKLLKDI